MNEPMLYALVQSLVNRILSKYYKVQFDSLKKLFFSVSKRKLATAVKGDPKAPFSLATTLGCRRNTFPKIASL